MNRRDLKPIHAELLRDLPGFVACKRMLLMAPMQGFLRAIHFNPSGFSRDDFDVQPIIMPLCIPSDHLYLTFGNRIYPSGPPRGWKSSMPDLIPLLRESIRKEALPFLISVRSALDFADMARAFWQAPHTPKDVALVLARGGHTALALSVLEKAIPIYSKLDMDNDWQKKLFEDTRDFRNLLRNDPDEAQRKLGEWEDYTIEELGLGKFR